jgi:ABC-type amino acid transport substrate-binding protein
MKPTKTFFKAIGVISYLTIWLVCLISGIALAADLPEIKNNGVIRHLGIPYANFVTGSGDGMDVDLVKLFAQHLGVRYEYVKTSWGTVIGDLIGRKVQLQSDQVVDLGEVPVKGDIIANGFTVLPTRKKVLDYSNPTFPNQVWLVVKASSPLKPIVPSGDINKDIAMTKAIVKGHVLLGKTGTCLDPSLYDMKKFGATIKLFDSELNKMAPAVINDEAEMTLLDVPDALVALEKWPGQIKVIGPLSEKQDMACGFAKTSPQLRQAFNEFLEKCKQDGTYLGLIKKYYPMVLDYFPEFFAPNK